MCAILLNVYALDHSNIPWTNAKSQNREFNSCRSQLRFTCNCNMHHEWVVMTNDKKMDWWEDEKTNVSEFLTYRYILLGNESLVMPIAPQYCRQESATSLDNLPALSLHIEASNVISSPWTNFPEKKLYTNYFIPIFKKIIWKNLYFDWIINTTCSS